MQQATFDGYYITVGLYYGLGWWFSITDTKTGYIYNTYGAQGKRSADRALSAARQWIRHNR